MATFRTRNRNVRHSSPKLTPQMHPQVEKILVKRCYVSFFNADETLVENFSIPKSRGPGNFSIPFQNFAWNADTLVAEGFLEFNDQVYTTTIHERLAELGARSIAVMTFQNNDNNHSAASALNRVRTVAKSDGFVSVVRGTCNAKLLAKADELLAEEKQEKNAEFDEKTQAAMKLSLEMTEEIKSNMATKEGLSHLESITQLKADELKTSFVEMDAKMQSNYKTTITGQAAIISEQTGIINSQQKANAELNESLIINDRKMMNLERQNESQRFIIAKLNAERDQMTKEIKELTKDNLALHSSQGAAAVTLNQFRELLAEFQTDRKRKHNDE